ncbi:MAG: citrate synthase [Bernardetiaceae bacterium]
MSDQLTAELHYKGKTYELPVVVGTEQEEAIDISKLRDQSGLITLDPGYKNTGATTSEITFLDGEKGILNYRGYSIEELTEKSNFLEISYLLIYGKLPTETELLNFNNAVTEHTLIHEDMRKIFEAFPAAAHPMGILATMVSALTAFYPNSLDPYRPAEEVELTIIRLLAKVPTIAAWAYKNEMGHPYMYPDNSKDYVARFLKMMFGLPTDEYEVDPVQVAALDKLLILHADHEQNCSTSTIRIVGSALANLYSGVASAISALGGPLHGGANQAVLNMLERIQAEGGNVRNFLDKAKDKNSDVRLMGFGHRVYKNFDPRANIIKKYCDEVLDKMGKSDQLLDIARELEQAALSEDYFIERKLYPNVDFYSGIIYRALGIPTDMFTVMFALGRMPGWIAQWKEMKESKQPIGRPRQIYTGATLRSYTPIEQR